MEINLTFCIQVINFLLFYHGISYFFLKPFVKFIQMKNASRERMLEDLATKELQLKKLVHDRVELGLKFKAMLKERYLLPSAPLISLGEESSPVPLTEQQCKTMRTQLIAHFVAEIKNAY